MKWPLGIAMTMLWQLNVRVLQIFRDMHLKIDAKDIEECWSVPFSTRVLLDQGVCLALYFSVLVVDTGSHTEMACFQKALNVHTVVLNNRLGLFFVHHAY